MARRRAAPLIRSFRVTVRTVDPTLPSSSDAVNCAGSAADWTVIILHSPALALLGQRVSLDSELRMGREAADDVDLVIEDAKVSRRHMTLTRTGLVVELRDDGSSNGTHVNGLRVRTHVLRPGDIVRAGETLLQVDLATIGAPRDHQDLVGGDPAFEEAVELAARVAPSSVPVLIQGETGTGKDLLARHIHARSGRAGSYVAVNCAALPHDLVESALFGHRKGAFTGAAGNQPGFFMAAQGGTLFLDEVGELTLAHQAKLLRALDTGEIVPVGAARSLCADARVVAATNADLLARTAAGGFREDLYARLAGAVVHMPPLRRRRCDILTLARHFLAREPLERRLTGQAAERLVLHPWPRNVRELQSVVRRLCLRAGDRMEITRDDVAAVLDPPVGPDVPAPRPARPARTSVPARDELVELLSALHGNVSRLAERYGKDAKQIYRWLKRHGIDPQSYR
jgi:DNA-binding NtrC family response regulator